MVTKINFPIDLSHRDYDLTGPEGNAFAVMGFVTSAIKQLGNALDMDRDEINNICEEYRKKAMSGNYENLLKVSNEYVDINFCREEEDY